MNDAVLQLEITRGQRRSDDARRERLAKLFNLQMEGRQGQRRSGSAPDWLAWTVHPRDYYIAWLLLLAVGPYVLSYLDSLSGLGTPVNGSTRTAYDFGLFFLDMLLPQHFVLLVLIIPASLASSFSVEKSRGILGIMLASNLTPADIVLGKFAARAGHIGWVLLLGLPILCFLGVPGLNPPMIVVVIVVSAVMIFTLGAASTLAAVRCRNATDAFIAVLLAAGFAIGVIAAVHFWADELKAMRQPSGLVAALDGFLQLLNPLPIWDAVRVLDPKESWFIPLVIWAAAWAVAGAICLILAVASLRHACLCEAETPARARRRPPVSDNPVHWKARHLDAIAVPGLGTLPRWTGPALVFAGSASFFLLWQLSLASAILEQSIVFGLLLMSVVAFHVTQTVFTENDTGALADLRLTGIEPRELVGGKIRGMFQASIPYFAAGATPALIAAGINGVGTLLLLSVCLLVLAFCLYSTIVSGFDLALRFRQAWQAALMAVYFGGVAGGIVYVPALLFLFSAFVIGPGSAAAWIHVWAFLLISFFATLGFVTDSFGFGASSRSPLWFANRRIVRHLELVVQTEDPRRSIQLGLITPYPWFSAWARWLAAPIGNFESTWNKLASKNEREADRTILILRRAMNQTVAHMKTRLHPVPPVDSARIVELIQALDSHEAITYEKAARELTLYRHAEPHLVRVLARSTSSRQRARVQALLEELENRPFPQDTRRGLRAIEVLERIGTKDAREILRSLAAGAEEAPLTQAARAALQRQVAAYLSAIRPFG